MGLGAGGVAGWAGGGTFDNFDPWIIINNGEGRGKAGGDGRRWALSIGY